MANFEPEFKAAGPSTSNAKVFSILAYIGILWLIGLLVAPEKDDPFVKNHVNNGIILAICGVVGGIVAAIPIIGWIIGGVAEVAILVFAIMGIVAAFQDTTFTIPVIGDKFTVIK